MLCSALHHQQTAVRQVEVEPRYRWFYVFINVMEHEAPCDSQGERSDRRICAQKGASISMSRDVVVRISVIVEQNKIVRLASGLLGARLDVPYLWWPFPVPASELGSTRYSTSIVLLKSWNFGLRSSLDLLGLGGVLARRPRAPLGSRPQVVVERRGFVCLDEGRPVPQTTTLAVLELHTAPAFGVIMHPHLPPALLEDCWA